MVGFLVAIMAIKIYAVYKIVDYVRSGKADNRYEYVYDDEGTFIKVIDLKDEENVWEVTK